MKKNILLVDDESIFHFLASKIISICGVDANIHSAHDGQQAIDALMNHYLPTSQVPDFIFIDLDMPKMNGFQFIEAFQSMAFPNKHNITLAVLSSSETVSERDRALSLGANYYFSKPLSEKQVKEMILKA